MIPRFSVIGAVAAAALVPEVVPVGSLAALEAPKLAANAFCEALPAVFVSGLMLTTISMMAQARPDFSGGWKISQAKSSAGATGNNATISFASELVIKQQAAELHVELRYPRSEVLRTDEGAPAKAHDGQLWSRNRTFLCFLRLMSRQRGIRVSDRASSPVFPCTYSSTLALSLRRTLNPQQVSGGSGTNAP